MKKMVRKQIYIQKSQEERLKRVAETRGVSEAEIIRRALDNELKRAGYRLAYDNDAMQRLYKMMRDQDKKHPVPRKKRDWMREDLYEDRMKRYDRRSS
ncbi:MAG: ribbon-helix-helix protein, CopG family [Anaerolineae bacterium]|nr:ribbon-helix-helix protein, CopG family [Anaerolineae bacterium]MBL8106153.1 ribbon-helix-helix protein, CopG family [Anaerolineales bacterium]MCC6299005.1 ribbon-helix-helix protein, CopG family [Anaerolineales bacterium]